jgi:hypothetical protein
MAPPSQTVNTVNSFGKIPANRGFNAVHTPVHSCSYREQLLFIVINYEQAMNTPMNTPQHTHTPNFREIVHAVHSLSGAPYKQVDSYGY